MIPAYCGVQGTVSILLVYDQAPLDNSKYNIYFADVSKAVMTPTFTNIWSGGSDPATLQAFIDNMKAGQFVVTTLQPTASDSVSSINLDLVSSGILPPNPPSPPPAPGPTTTPPPGNVTLVSLVHISLQRLVRVHLQENQIDCMCALPGRHATRNGHDCFRRARHSLHPRFRRVYQDIRYYKEEQDGSVPGHSLRGSILPAILGLIGSCVF